MKQTQPVYRKGITVTVIEELKKLEQQRDALVAQAKAEALAKAEEAIETLNALGFHYELTHVTADKPVPVRTTRVSTGRRGGIRDEVLAVIQEHPDGITPKGIITALNADDDEKKQTSIRNALNNMKKAGAVNASDGVYRAA